MLTDELRAEGWIEHDGGPCPVPLDSRVHARSNKARLDGAVLFARADRLIWRNIIAYKPETTDAR